MTTKEIILGVDADTIRNFEHIIPSDGIPEAEEFYNALAIHCSDLPALFCALAVPLDMENEPTYALPAFGHYYLFCAELEVFAKLNSFQDCLDYIDTHNSNTEWGWEEWTRGQYESLDDDRRMY